jgi:hypothetical protein
MLHTLSINCYHSETQTTLSVAGYQITATRVRVMPVEVTQQHKLLKIRYHKAPPNMRNTSINTWIPHEIMLPNIIPLLLHEACICPIGTTSAGGTLACYLLGWYRCATSLVINQLLLPCLPHSLAHYRSHLSRQDL